MVSLHKKMQSDNFMFSDLVHCDAALNLLLTDLIKSNLSFLHLYEIDSLPSLLITTILKRIRISEIT